MTYAEIQATAAANEITVSKLSKGYAIVARGEEIKVAKLSELEAALNDEINRIAESRAEFDKAHETEAPKADKPADNGADQAEDPLAELARLKEQLAAAQNQIQALSSRKRGRPAKVKTPEELAEEKRKAEWEVVPLAEEGTFLRQVQDMDRIEQCNVLAKLARKLPWRQVPEMVQVVYNEALNQLYGAMPEDATDEAKEARREQAEALWAEVTTRKPRNRAGKAEGTDEAPSANGEETSGNEPEAASEAEAELATV